jgi:hypothetical protein
MRMQELHFATFCQQSHGPIKAYEAKGSIAVGRDARSSSNGPAAHTTNNRMTAVG